MLRVARLICTLVKDIFLGVIIGLSFIVALLLCGVTAVIGGTILSVIIGAVLAMFSLVVGVFILIGYPIAMTTTAKSLTKR